MPFPFGSADPPPGGDFDHGSAWWRRPCLNCAEPGRCLCWSCLRAIVVPVLIVEGIRWLFR